MHDAYARSSDIDWEISVLARACAEEGRFTEALRHYRSMLRGQLKRFGPNHPQVATINQKYAHTFWIPFLYGFRIDCIGSAASASFSRSRANSISEALALFEDVLRVLSATP